MPRWVSLWLLVVALGAVAAACDSSPSPGGTTGTPTAAERVEVRIDGLVVRAEVARTPEERSQGLSGQPSLPHDGGMLFVFEEERRPGFWMWGMRFPLDFIWISRERRVVDLTEDVPPPEPGTPDDELPRYQPVEPALYVLEVNAGVVRESGVALGDVVTFEPDILEESAP